MMRYFTCVVFSLFFFLAAHAGTIEIRYRAPGAEGLKMIWGINGWDYSESSPEGTFIEDKAMHTPMKKEGDDFVLKFNLPDSTILDFLFYFTRVTGPFDMSFGYLDVNNPPVSQNYHYVVNGNMVVKLKPDYTITTPSKDISLLDYATFFLVLFGTMSIVLLAIKKIIFKTASTPLKPVYLFIAISLALLCTLVIIRAKVTDMAVQFLATPKWAIPIVFKSTWYDFLYTFSLTLLFGCLFFLRRKKPRIVLYVFAGLACVSIVACLLNIKIIELLGRPFTYQWLYYSDFLKSTDAKQAVSANVDAETLIAYGLLILAAISLAFLLYQLLIKKPFIVLVLFVACGCIGLFTRYEFGITDIRKKNPVSYFLASLTKVNGIPSLSVKNSGDEQEFTIKNTNVMPPQFAERFAEANITNVIVYVLESTPAEYLTVYNPAFNTTPFLDSLKSSAAIFHNVYAHAPTTNKSMVSLLCGAFPYLSHESLTASKPDIKWPSISSELQKAGYRSSFLNSADNRYNGAGDFLEHRGFDEIQDFRQNPCNADTFSNTRYPDESLDGINDACLPVKFFNWIGNDNKTPFFSLMWTYQTHYPYYPTGQMIDFGTNNDSHEKYLNALHHSDKVLRELVEGLQKRDLLKSTLIVIVGDHGEAFGRHGQTSHAGGIFEENLHIPLMLINPQLFRGEHFSLLGGMSDIAPTIFSVLNKPLPDAWQGENLFSINRRKRVYYFNPYSDFLFGCREGDYKLIYNATTNTFALFNLRDDPHEANNIADKQPDVVNKMNRHLNAWMNYQTGYVNAFLK